MKLFIFLFGILLYSTQLISQDNEFEIIQVSSPIGNEMIDTNSTLDIIATVLNVGPNDIIGIDSIIFNVKIATKDTTIFIDTNIQVGTAILKSSARQFLIIDDYLFKEENTYQVCINVNGSVFYYKNTSKKPGPCVGVLVGEEELSQFVDKLYYSNGTLNLELNQPVQNGEIQIFNISGQEITKRRIDNSRYQQIKFTPESKGVYFLKLFDQKGEQAINKFIVH